MAESAPDSAYSAAEMAELRRNVPPDRLDQVMAFADRWKDYHFGFRVPPETAETAFWEAYAEGRGDTTTDHVEISALRAYVQAQSAFLAAYRTGRRPPESAFRAAERAKRDLKAIGRPL